MSCCWCAFYTSRCDVPSLRLAAHYRTMLRVLNLRWVQLRGHTLDKSQITVFYCSSKNRNDEEPSVTARMLGGDVKPTIYAFHTEDGSTHHHTRPHHRHMIPYKSKP
jgi:hypothetical protein